MIIPSSEPPSAQRSTGTPVNVQSVGSNGLPGHLMGQFAQGNAVANQNTYIGGRLTPQAMQQGKRAEFKDVRSKNFYNTDFFPTFATVK